MTGEIGRWAPTHAHLRAVVLAVACLAVAIIGRRMDVTLLGVPFLVAAAWGAHHRPTNGVTASLTIDERTLFEGQSTRARITMAGDTGDLAAVVVASEQRLEMDPPSGAVVVAADSSPVHATVGLRAAHWGRPSATLRVAVCTSRLGAFRTSRLHDGPLPVTCLPLGVSFGASEAMPRPAGLVGLHRANRQGSGSEPAEIRPFRTGDRLRRINWRVSSRTGDLHVTSTWSDRDTHVLLLLDTENDIGASGGVDGPASTLDTAIRAAAAIAEHYLRAGDRVGLFDLGRRVHDVPVSGGRHQLRRVLEALVLAEATGRHRPEPVHLRPVGAGALVIVLSPLVGRTALAQVAHMVRHGHTIVVVDTLAPAHSPPLDPWTALAARLRAMERGVDIDRLGDLGVPVVPWRGPGTLDEVLRDVSRLALAPRPR